MIHFVPETGSTSHDVSLRLRGGAVVPEGEWLVADRQSAGKGRSGRVWLDGGLGNFMGTTVVHLRPGDPPPSSFALSVALAVHQAVAEFGQNAVLKWPNDLMVGGAKLAGVLLERIEASVIVGVGVNLASAPDLPDRETVSLGALGINVDRDVFAIRLAKLFDVELERWRNFGLAPVISRWLAAAHPAGTRLRVGDPGQMPLEGEFAGLTDDGALQLRLSDGTTRIMNAGDVSLAGY